MRRLRSGQLFWTGFLLCLAISVALTTYVCCSDGKLTPIARVTASSDSSLSYEILIGGANLCYRETAGEIWTCNLDSSTPPPIEAVLSAIRSYQEVLQIPLLAFLAGLCLWFLMALVIGLVHHIGHKYMTHDRHIHIYRPLFATATLLIESFFSACCCMVAAMALQMIQLSDQVTLEDYAITSKPAVGFALLLSAGSLSILTLIGSFTHTAFNRLHHLQLPESMGGNPTCPSMTLPKFPLPERQHLASMAPTADDAILMRQSWVKRTLPIEEADLKSLADGQDKEKDRPSSRRSSMAESLFSAVPVPPAYTRAQSRSGSLPK